jgi:recombination protein RecT
MSQLPATLKDVPNNEIQPLINKWEKVIVKVMGTDFNVNRMLGIAVSIVQSKPKLKECSLSSLIGAILYASQVGLDLSPVLDQCYLVPFKGQVTYMIGYKGLCTLSYRSGKVETIFSNVIYRNEKRKIFFNEQKGFIVKHKPMIEDAANRGDMIAAYVRMKIVRGEPVCFALPAKDIIDTHKLKSKAANSADSPWNVPAFEKFMWQKSVLKELIKTMPFSLEDYSLNIDNQVFEVENFNQGKLLDYKIDKTKDIDYESRPEDQRLIFDKLNQKKEIIQNGKTEISKSDGFESEKQRSFYADWHAADPEVRVKQFNALLKNNAGFTIGDILKTDTLIPNDKFNTLPIKAQIEVLWYLTNQKK